jgi:hypothetical protein
MRRALGTGWRAAGILTLPALLAGIGMPGVAVICLTVTTVVIAICWITADDRRTDRAARLIAVSRGRQSSARKSRTPALGAPTRPIDESPAGLRHREEAQMRTDRSARRADF